MSGMIEHISLREIALEGFLDWADPGTILNSCRVWQLVSLIWCLIDRWKVFKNQSHIPQVILEHLINNVSVTMTLALRNKKAAANIFHLRMWTMCRTFSLANSRCISRS